MIIKNIEINNFRVYKGKNFIDLSPSDGRNISIISGNNGYGKTTFLMSLVWCLYGKNMNKVDDIYREEIQPNYPKYINASLNKEAGKEGETTISVALTLSDVKIPTLSSNKDIKIIRSYDTKLDKEDLKINIEGDNDEFDGLFEANDNGKENQQEYFIRDYILPIEIAKFFFFDAEKIVSFAKSNNRDQVKELGKAYSQVLGIQKYDDLIGVLESLRDDYRSKSANDKDKINFDSYITAIKVGDEKINKLKDEIAKLQRDIGPKNLELEDLQKALYRAGDTATQNDIDELMRRKEYLLREKESAEEDLKELYRLIPFGLAGFMVSNVMERLKKERKYRQDLSQRSDVEDNIENILSDLGEEERHLPRVIDREICTFYKNNIRTLIRKYFCASLDDEKVDILHDFNESSFEAFSSLISKIKDTEHSFAKSYNIYNKSKQELDAINREITNVEKNAETAQVQELREKKNIIENNIAEINRTIGEKENEIAHEEAEMIANKKRKESLSSKINVSKENEPVDKELESLIFKLKNFLSEFQKARKMSLQSKLEEKLKMLFHKENLFDKVVVDLFQGGGNYVDFSIYKDGEIKDKNSFSMGERQMFASALLAALVDETNISFPVFIDSPMQKFDTAHKKNALEKFYPNVSKQVILFPLLREELTEKGYEMISDKINKTYLIEHLNGASTFRSVDPNELFNE